MFTGEEFPEAESLRSGALLRARAPAVWTADHPDFAHLVEWVKGDYLLQNDQGAHGAIAFLPDAAVGVFFDADSQRNPLVQAYEYRPEANWEGAPRDQAEAIERRALPHMPYHDIAGKRAWLVTSALT
jgi:hypothetical protein